MKESLTDTLYTKQLKSGCVILSSKEMMKKIFHHNIRLLAVLLPASILFQGCVNVNQGNPPMQSSKNKVTEKIFKSDEEWKKVLTPEQYQVLRQKGTDRPHTGLYDQFFVKGRYYCAACGLELFESGSKFDAGCGWPSFSEQLESGHIEEHRDLSYGMVRTEVVCSRCGGHLGHVFNDGPPPTGLRYCINSTSLVFKNEDQLVKEKSADSTDQQGVTND